MRRSTQVSSRKARLLALSAAAVSQAVLASFRAATAYAAPQGMHVVRGSVSVTQNGSVMDITASNNSIINFTGFDIAKGETVDIIEPSAHSRVLDRVIGTSATLIDGSLLSNGQVFIVNPLGITFGASATINVAGLTAIAGQLSDSNFIAGRNRFTNLAGSVNNQGQIVSTGPTALVGSSVSNAGSISAGKGTVVLAAGSEVFVGSHGSNIYAKVQGSSDSLAAGIAGSGDIYSLALTRGSQVQGGQVLVQGAGDVQVSGTVDASNATTGAKGGSVAITGAGNVQLTSATVNASGAAGGGTIQIGGGFRGQGRLPNAAQTSISADSTLQADALINGNGGKVVVWANQATDFEGSISAQGAGTGAGGSAEISSAGTSWTYNPATPTNLTGPGGVGMLLLDPVTFTIAPTGGDETGAQLAAMVTSANVTVSATSEVFVHDTVDISGTPNTLTLDAPTIDFTEPVILSAAGQLSGSAAITTVDVHVGGLIQNGVDVLPTGTVGTLNVDPGVYTDPTVTISKKIVLDNTGGTTAFVQAGTWVITAPISVSGAFSATGAAGFNFSAAAPVTLTGNVSLATTAGNIFFGSTVDGDFNLLLNSNGGTEEFEAAVGGITPLANLTVAGSGGTTTIAAAVITTGAGQSYGDAVTTTGTSLALSAGAGTITFMSTLTGANTAVSVNGQDGNIFDGLVLVKSLHTTGAGGTTFNVASGVLVSTTAGQSYGDAVTLTTGGAANSVSFVDNSGSIIFGSTLTGPLAKLTVNGAGGDVFGSTVTVVSLNTVGAGGTTFTGSGTLVTTTAGQSYGNAVSITSGTTSAFLDSSGTITFGSTLSGSAAQVTVNGAGGNVFHGAVSLASLNTLGSGGTQFTASGTVVSTSGSQSYNNAVTVTGGTAGFAASAGTIRFSSTLTGSLTSVSVAGADGNIFGGHLIVKSLIASGAGGTEFTSTGLVVTTTGGQTYQDSVTFAGSPGTGALLNVIVNDSSQKITFNGITGTGVSLAVNGAGGNVFNGPVKLGALISQGLSTNVKSSITTTGGQTYNNAVTLGPSSGASFTDTKGVITFNKPLTGNSGTPLTLTGNLALDAEVNNNADIFFGSGTRISGVGPVISTTHIGTNGQAFLSPQFMSGDAADAGQFGSNFSIASGARNIGLATIIAAQVSFEAPVPQVITPALTPVQASELAELGIYVKTGDEEQADLSGQASNEIIIDDWPAIHGPRPSDRRISSRRLDAAQVKQVVHDLERLYGPNGVHKKQITAQIAAAIAEYRAAAKPADGKITPSAFARFLATGATAQQRSTMQQMRKLAAEIDGLGLSSTETASANQTWTYELMPDDEGLVNSTGQYYNGWLLDTLKDLRPQ